MFLIGGICVFYLIDGIMEIYEKKTFDFFGNNNNCNEFYWGRISICRQNIRWES